MSIVQYDLKLNDNLIPRLKKSKSYHWDAPMNCSSDVIRFFQEKLRIHENAEEHVYLLTVTSKLEGIALFEVSHGINNASFCGSREIMIRVLLSGASRFFIVHNHPSGIPIPSQDDYKSANAISESASMLGVPLADFIIIGRNKYKSFKEEMII